MGVAIILVIAIAGMLMINQAQQGSGNKIVVEAGGSGYKQIKLTENTTTHIELENHNSVDVIVKVKKTIGFLRMKALRKFVSAYLLLLEELCMIGAYMTAGMILWLKLKIL